MNLRSTFIANLCFSLVLLGAIGSDSYIYAQSPQGSVKGFVANVGQWPSEVLFAHRDGNLDTWITKNGIVFDQYEIKRAAGIRDGQVVRLSWTGSAGGTPIGEVRSPSMLNFFIGKDPTAWRTNVPVYTKVRVSGIYRGIDAIYYIDKGNVRYDLDVHAGADLTAVSMSVDGSNGLTVAPEKISIATSKGAIVMADLFAYFLSGKNRQTAASFAPRGSGFSIEVPAHTSDKPLLIDPVVYGTFVGGDAFDKTVGVEHVAGGILVGGSTEGMAFPPGTGGYQSSLKASLDAFVALYSKDLQRILSYTYYGGTGADAMTAMTTDASGSPYFVGESNSADLPISVGAAGQIYRGLLDAFVVKLNPTLSKLEISTYIGGNKDDRPTSVAVDVSGGVFVAGGTNSNLNFPTALGHQKTLGGQVDGFLCRLSSNGSSFVFSTYFGREGNETFAALALNSSGEPFVTGTTSSANFETAPTPGRFSSGRLPYDRTFNGGNTDAFVVKFFSDGTLSKRDDGTYSTFFGGNAEDAGTGIFVDQGGRAVVVGTTTSTNLPALGSYLTQPVGRRDIFMAVFADDGRALASCTYFGGTGDDDVLGIRPLNATATGILFGTTTSNDFPSFGAGVNPDRIGVTDGFITVFNTSTLIHSTLIAGSTTDSINAISLDSRGDIYYSVASQSTDLYVGDSAYSKTNAGKTDGYIGKYAFGTLAIQSPSGGESWCIGSTNAVTWGVEEMLVNEEYQVELSTDGGSTWSNLARDLTSKSYAWKPAATLQPGAGYRIRVLTERGHVSSSGSFTLNQGPSVSEQPKDAAACVNAPVELMVGASGAGLKYQWRRNGAVITGATTAKYSIAALNTMTAGSYECIVTGTCNPSVTSRAAIVSISAATSITKQPLGATVEEGKPLALSVTASGSSLAYQWAKDGTPITGATSSEYKLVSAALADAGKYSCTITGGCGNVTTDEVTVIVTPTTSVDEDYEAGDTWVKVIGPSPATDAVAIRVRLSEQTPASARVYNEQGLLVGTIDLGLVEANESDVQISLSRFVSGVYVVEIKAGARVGHVRVVIRR